MEIKVHERTLRVPKVILSYDEFVGNTFIIDRQKDGSLLIDIVSRAGDVSIFHWCHPEETKNPTAEIWEYELYSAYDATRIRFGKLKGCFPPDKDPLDDYIANALHQECSISPKDRDGFLRLRPAPGSRFSYTGNTSVARKTPGHIINDKSNRSCIPINHILANRVSKDDLFAIGLVQLIILAADRCDVIYRNDSNAFTHKHLPYDYDEYEYGTVESSLNELMEDAVNAILDEVSGPVGLGRSQQRAIYIYLCQFFDVLQDKRDDRPYHGGVYHAIAL